MYNLLWFCPWSAKGDHNGSAANLNTYPLLKVKNGGKLFLSLFGHRGKNKFLAEHLPMYKRLLKGNV